MTQELPTTDTRTGDAGRINVKTRPARKPLTATEPKRKTKSDTVLALLTRSRGATINEMMKATGWQSHSVRGFLAGNVKKKLSRNLVSEPNERGRIYRIGAESK